AVRGQIVDGVAEGFHQIAAKGHVVLSAHARPSAVNQRPQIVVRLRELSMTNQSGSLVGGIGIILKPFSISRSSAERGILASAVTRRSRNRSCGGREVMARPSFRPALTRAHTR